MAVYFSLGKYKLLLFPHTWSLTVNITAKTTLWHIDKKIRHVWPKYFYAFLIHYLSTELAFSPNVLPAKSDSDVMFCLQSYQGLRIDRSHVY